MKTVGCQPASRQRGIVSVLLVIIMITVVAFVLVQTFVISGTSSSDDSRQQARVGALTLAESGLQVATTKIMTGVDGSDSFDSSTNCCIGTTGSCLPPGQRVLVGNDTFEYVSVATEPAGCTSGCYACAVTIRGESGESTRTVKSIYKMSSMAFCKAASNKDCSNQKAPPPVWWLTLPGLTTPPVGIGVFNLAAAGNVGCWSGGCLAAGDLRWQLSDGSRIFGLGNTVPQTTAETSVYQRLSANTDVAQTGALFPGANGKTPTVVGAYADINTTKGNGTTGSTTDGASPGSAASWCYRDGSTPAGDTLVLGYSAHASGTSATGQLKAGEVSFNTIPLDYIAKSPHPTNKAAANTVSSELWYKHNPAYSYGTRILGTITGGTSFEGSFDVTFVQNKGVCVKTYNDFAASVKAGDVLNANDNDTKSAFGSSTITVNAVYNPGVSGNECANQYYFATTPQPKSAAQGSGKTFKGTITYKPRVLTVTEFVGGSNISLGDKVVGNAVSTSILADSTSTVIQLTGTGREGTYLLNDASAEITTPVAIVIGGATSTTVDGVTTVSVPKTPVPTTVTDGSTLVAVRLGNSVRAPDGSTTSKGRFAANTVIQKISPDRKSFTISPAAEVDLVGAEICGGTCALFDHSTTTTGFRLASSALPSGTDSWVAGFTCLDSAGEKPTSLNAAISIGRTWSEVAQ